MMQGNSDFNNNSANTFENNIQNAYNDQVNYNNQNNNQPEQPVSAGENLSIRQRGQARIKRRNKIILIVILVVVFCAGGYFLYDNYLKDFFNKNDEAGEKLTINNIKVVNAYKGDSNKISIPKIDANTKVIAALNEKMIVDSYQNIDVWRKIAVDRMKKNSASKEDVEDYYDCYNNITHAYKIHRNKGVLIINVYADSISRDGDTCWDANAPYYDTPEYYYFYDVKNDVEYDIYEAAKYLDADINSGSYGDGSLFCKNYKDLKTYTGSIHIELDTLGEMEIKCD